MGVVDISRQSQMLDNDSRGDLSSNAKDANASISGDRLIIKGEKEKEEEEKDEHHYFAERNYASFQRAFQVPPSV